MSPLRPRPPSFKITKRGGRRTYAACAGWRLTAEQAVRDPEILEGKGRGSEKSFVTSTYPIHGPTLVVVDDTTTNSATAYANPCAFASIRRPIALRPWCEHLSLGKTLA